MKNKIISISLLAISGIGVAQAEAINFAGTVSTSCTFSNQNAGSLGATASPGGDYLLSAGLNGSGAPASVDIAYSGAPTFGISAINSITTPNGAPTTNSLLTGIYFSGGNKSTENTTAATTAGANSFSAGVKTFTLDGGATSDTANITMAASASSPWPTGNYSASTTVTCQ